MTIIAITREIGTGSRQVAYDLARRLDLAIADSDFLDMRVADRIARRDRKSLPNGTDERQRAFERLLEIDDKTLASHADDEIREQAAYDNLVLRGWGAPSVLQDNPHVVRVRIMATTDTRLRRLAANAPSQSRNVLLQRICESDAGISANLEPVLGTSWKSTSLYHLTLEMDSLSTIEAVERIERYIRKEHDVRVRA